MDGLTVPIARKIVGRLTRGLDKGGSLLTSDAPRPVGLKIIIGYKLAKAPLMFALAVWLTIAPDKAFHFADRIAHELAEGGVLWIRLGKWLESHLSSSLLTRGAMLAWLDAITTSIEGILLLMGKTWGEWLVVLGLAMLIPFEMFATVHRPSWTKVLVLLANTAVVVYLARRRLGHLQKVLRQS